ncbi:hypothetical protein SAMN05216338_104010 [Bradyrhizobium sp. Rc2d]|nr:hypothetical protein SAMN05216338_104010 [Bradyrhizobium sp. Rc2d]
MKDCSERVSGFERAAVRMSKDDRADIFGKAKINRAQVWPRAQRQPQGDRVAHAGLLRHEDHDPARPRRL